MKGYSARVLALILVFGTLAGHCLAASSSITVSAVILSKSSCKFKTGAAVLDFGALDPVAALDVTRQATLDFVCQGSADPATYLASDDDGLNESGPNGNRMQHSVDSAAFLPYGLTLSPASATVPKGVQQTLTVTGTVLGNDYRSAIAGAYSDTVTLTITP